MTDIPITENGHHCASNGRDYANGVSLDPMNLEGSLKQLEEYMIGLRLERSSAQRALTAQSDLVGTVAHEMRTALGNIYAFSDLMLGTELNGEQHHYATCLKQTADGLLVLLNDVLDHTRLTEGRLEPFQTGVRPDGAPVILRHHALRALPRQGTDRDRRRDRRPAEHPRR